MVLVNAAFKGGKSARTIQTIFVDDTINRSIKHFSEAFSAGAREPLGTIKNVVTIAMRRNMVEDFRRSLPS
jgi:hypothetical protein